MMMRKSLFITNGGFDESEVNGVSDIALTLNFKNKKYSVRKDKSDSTRPNISTKKSDI